jgi:type I restriction enzyme M protein
LDDKRNPIEANDLPEVLERWDWAVGCGKGPHRGLRSHSPYPRAEIAEQGYDLSINRYKEVEYEEAEHRAPLDIIADIEKLDAEIAQDLADLKAMLS